MQETANQSNTERFIDVDNTKREQIAKLGTIAETLRQENINLKEQMNTEFSKLKQNYEQELKF
jgi:hypothetical protein